MLDCFYLWFESFYVDNNIMLCLGIEVMGIDFVFKVIVIGDEILFYDELVLIIGFVFCCLFVVIGGDFEGVYIVCDLLDVDVMVFEFVEGKLVLIVGGGYIGFEVVVVVVKKGLNVMLVEMVDCIL